VEDSLKTCTSCDGHISMKAKVCRFCQAKQGGKSPFLYPLIVMVAVGGGYYAMKGNDQPPAPVEVTKEASLSTAVADQAAENNSSDQEIEIDFEPPVLNQQPTLLELPKKPNLTKPSELSKANFVDELLADPEFATGFKSPVNRTATLKLTSGSSYKCKILAIDGDTIKFQISKNSVKMTLVSSDIAAGQRSFLFKDIYRTAEAIKLFKKEYQVYENAVETYENALQDWQDEYDRVKKENRRLKNSVNL
jgi:hypothetical protein